MVMVLKLYCMLLFIYDYMQKDDFMSGINKMEYI